DEPGGSTKSKSAESGLFQTKTRSCNLTLNQLRMRQDVLMKGMFSALKRWLQVIFLFTLCGSTSADPLDVWQWRNPLPQGNGLSDVAFDGDAFVAVGDNGAILHSTD